MDYRELVTQRPEWQGKFDRVISCEVVEAIGKDYMETFWGVVDWVLCKEDGVGVVQSTTLPEARVMEYDQKVDFIQKWVSLRCFRGPYMCHTDGFMAVADIPWFL